MPSLQSVACSQVAQTDGVPAIVYRKVNADGLFKHSNHGPLLRYLAFSPSGLFLGGAFDRRVIIWRLEGVEEDGSPGGHEEWAPTVIFSFNERTEEELSFFTWTNTDFLLIGSTSGDVKVGRYYDTGVTFKGFQASSRSVKLMALDSRGALLAVAAGDNELTVWCLEQNDWKSVGRLCHSDDQLGLFSEGRLEITFIGWKDFDENILVVAYRNHGVFAWNIGSMQCTTLLTQDRVYAAALSPDGRLISVAGKRGTFQIFDLDAKTKANTLTEPVGGSKGRLRTGTFPGQFIHDGQYFLGAGVGKINLWNAARSIRAQCLDMKPTFAQSPVTLLTISNTEFIDSDTSIRIAACSEGQGQEIEIWKARVRAYIPELSISPERSTAARDFAIGFFGMLVGGVGLYAALQCT